MTLSRWPAQAAVGDGARFYRPELDGLRFFAFLAVYLEHTVGSTQGGTHRHLPAFLGDLLGTIGAAGNFGVDLFFVLSSYLITELLLRELDARGSLNVRAFYLRRILRIWPLYFFVLAIAAVMAHVVPGEAFDLPHVLAFTLFAGNWAYMLFPVVTIAGPLWSVSLEEQFYLVWPWLIGRLRAGGIRSAALGMVVLSTVTTAVLGSLYPDQDLVSKNSFTRINGIAVGAWIASTLRGGVLPWSSRRRWATVSLAIAGLLFVAYAGGLFARPASTLAVMLGWPVAAVCCGAILVSVLGCGGMPGAVLRSAPLVYLGRISFGLYTYHEIFLRMADSLFPQHGQSLWQMVAYWNFGLILTIAVAALSYRWLELPFLRLKQGRYTLVASRPD